eukprot:TRINITY_DN29432_c0_g1_i1.p1 TRINITY_DN29432_c0_g1~~TRINITY_DN29432_c0_g1_i1.p1  ORF type:complete len:397 (+),score=111.12 TRINITY_DN29432_c0_g1_i1:73-1263(+)
MLRKLWSAVAYDTPKYARIRSWRIALLYYFLSSGILFYIFYFSIYRDKGFQETAELVGSVMIKVKGQAVANASGLVYDASDLVAYSAETGSVFLPVREEVTTQTRGECPGIDSKEECSSDADCTEGRPTDNGIDTGRCSTSSGHCVIRGWCPPEDGDDGNATAVSVLRGIEDFTIFVRVDAAFPLFGAMRTNNVIRESDDGPHGLTWGVNLFKVSSLLNTSEIDPAGDFVEHGAVSRIKYEYLCNCDSAAHVYECQPDVEIYRVDDPQSNLSRGFNAREVVYIDDPDVPDASRVLRKWVGLLVQVIYTGRGGRFSVVALLTRLGAGMALLGVAGAMVDAFMIRAPTRLREAFLDSKYVVVELREDDVPGSLRDEYTPAAGESPVPAGGEGDVQHVV